MARLSVGNATVQGLADRILPLFFSAGSVNKLCERLNETLANRPGGAPVLLYPNRIHALLSDDPSRSLNDATVQLLSQAVDLALAKTDVSEESTPPTELLAAVRTQWQSSSRSQETLQEISGSLTIPPAVVRHVLEFIGELPKSGASGVVASATTDTAPGKQSGQRRRSPDWSFQDTAVQRCLQSLGVGPNRKIGLVVPTGGGKTRIALRVAFSILSRYAGSSARVLWLTHRRHLRTQAHRELQRMLRQGVKDLPDNSAELLAKRIDFVMLSELEAKLASAEPQPLLVIVDEAHHAAAPSYETLFAAPYPIRGLFLTATPNRTDGLPIGIDEIAYTITYRELADIGVILLPEFQPFPVADFDWSDATIRDLADAIISRSADEYVKTLVLAPRVSRVEEFHSALLNRLASEESHPLSADDIGFVHSTNNSHIVTDDDGTSRKASADEFLSHFSAKPRAIIVSAQMLLEGFDDPEINTVVITYPSESMIVLMQAAGRGVRHTAEKRQAFVLQARNDSIAYHLDHRWLYQEISDYLRPQLIDVQYTHLNDLQAKVRDLLDTHGVRPDAIMKDLNQVALGDRCRILLSGLPYYGPPDRFVHDARWSGLLETTRRSEAFRDLFNTFSALGAGLSDPLDFLRMRGTPHGVTVDFADGSDWRLYTDMLTSMYFAQNEIYGDGSTTAQGLARPFLPHGATTWLKYVTFQFAPLVPLALTDFLRDCHNQSALIADYQEHPTAYRLALKLPLPLAGSEGYLLSESQARSFSTAVDGFRAALTAVEPSRQFAELASQAEALIAPPIPTRLVTRIERFISDANSAALTLDLSALTTPTETSVTHEPLSAEADHA